VNGECTHLLSADIHFFGPLADTIKSIDEIRVMWMWADYEWFIAMSDSVLFVVTVTKLVL
jgi:hypothetical protein